MKKISYLLLVLLTVAILVPSSFAQQKKLADVEKEVAATDYSNVRIKDIPVAMQCWTFRELTFYETLKKVEKLGIKYLEAYPGQKIDKNSDPDDAFYRAVENGAGVELKRHFHVVANLDVTDDVLVQRRHEIALRSTS